MRTAICAAGILDLDYHGLRRVSSEMSSIAHRSTTTEAEVRLANRRVFVAPLVSIVIVNHNYGRYVEEAVQSVFAQTYPNIECLVVDNASTDDSRVVLDRLKDKYPSLQVVFRSVNDGQCAASVEVFPQTKGRYIVFMDADDALLPAFVKSHIYVNLSLTVPVGFTCSDMAQSVGHEIVLANSLSRSDVVTASGVPPNGLLRSGSFMSSIIEHDHTFAPVEETECHLINQTTLGWPWTATSAFMFRREAIEIFIKDPGLTQLTCALDVYFARGINAITGSVVIARSLAVYRMHGANVFSRHPRLENMLNFTQTSQYNQNITARRALIAFFFSNIDGLLGKISSGEGFVNAISSIDKAYPPLRRSNGQCFAAEMLCRHLDKVRRVIGLGTLLRWCIILRVNPIALAGAFRRSESPQIPAGKTVPPRV